jgi:CheY-like chemotaxis protein
VKRSILLADDSPTIQRLVKQTFVDADLEIVAVSNGDAAVKKLSEVRPHLVLADVYMPGRNGYEVCTFIKNQPAYSNTPVVLLVGAFDAFDMETAKQAGASAHITKPFEPQALVDLVNSLLASVATDTADEAPASPPVDSAGAAGQTEPAAADPEAEGDLMGLSDLFAPAAPSAPASLGDDQVEKIVDLVVKKLSTDAIQNVAWDVVPDIVNKAVKDTLKKQA